MKWMRMKTKEDFTDDRPSVVIVYNIPRGYDDGDRVDADLREGDMLR